MGSSLHIIALSDDQGHGHNLVAWASERVFELEQRWSRFSPTSEISQLNTNPGQPMVVSSDTMTLIQAAIEARDLSQGRFDPTMLQAMKANGYDRTFVSITTPVGMPALDTRRIGLGQIALDHATNTVTFGASTGFDPGGIGKGLAADLVATEMMQRGAGGALVNVGGDVRCVGAGPANGSWLISIGDTVAGVDNRIVELDQGAVASSTSKRRQWRRCTHRGVEIAHHLLDPATGQPAERAATLVTVIAARCADAEWLATAVASAGSLDFAASIAGEATVMMTDADGEYSSMGAPRAFLR